MPRRSALVPFAVTVSTTIAAPMLAQAPFATPAQLQKLEDCARQLARAGLGDAAAELADVLPVCGADPAAAAALRKTSLDAAAKVKKPKAAAPDVARTLRRTAQALAEALAAQPDAERERLARAVLQLDSEQSAAHVALGRTLVDDVWSTSADRQRQQRRAEIEDVLRQARRLTFSFTASPSDDPLLTAVLGKPGTCLRGHGLEVHGSWPEAQLRRVLCASLRAVAVGNWLTRGQLTIPETMSMRRWIVLPSRDQYLRAVDHAAAAGQLAGTAAEAKRLGGFFGYRDFLVDSCATEADSESCFVSHLVPDLALPCLTAAHTNWLCLTCFGVRLPVFTFDDGSGARPRDGRTVASAAEVEERARMQRLAEAGLLGTRAWMQYLVDRGEDPPWSRSFVDQVGKLTGDDLCKATLVMDFLHEHGQLAAALREPTAAGLAPDAQARFLEQALEEPLAQFEERWRASLRSQRPGLVQRLERPATRTTDPVAKEVLACLMALRRPALEAAGVPAIVEVEVDTQLARGAQAHAEYLVRHPKQLAAWPDAHEEYPDQEGFSALGSWGGLHSVIAPGVTSPQGAIDAWMATFYHRLPLLEEGLLRVGYGTSGDVAVLDAASMCRPRTHRSVVLWPYDGMRDVPVAFRPELPNPVPGADQSQWGYPVTLQLGEWSTRDADDRPLEVRMTLHAGSSGAAPEVPCHLSTPEQPTNVELAPPGTWCLIPQRPLKKGATYTIVVRIAGEAEDRVAQFRT